MDKLEGRRVACAIGFAFALAVVLPARPGHAAGSNRPPDPVRRLAFADPPPPLAACYDVRRSGVTWDGVSDDAPAIEAAVAAAIAAPGGVNGACIQLPRGTGLVSEIDLPNFTGLRIVGSGQGATFVKFASRTGNMFVTAVNNTKTTSFEASDFTVLPAEGGQTAGTTFELSNVFGIRLHDLTQNGGWNWARFGTDPIPGTGLIKGDNNVHQDFLTLRNFKSVVTELGSGFDYWENFISYDTDIEHSRCDDISPECQPLAFFIARNWGGVYLSNDDPIHAGTCFLFQPDVPGKAVQGIVLTSEQCDTSAGSGYVFHATPGTQILDVAGTMARSSSNGGDGFLVNEEQGTTGNPGKIHELHLSLPVAINNYGNGIHFLVFNSLATIDNPHIGINASYGNTGAVSGIQADYGSGVIHVNGGSLSGPELGFGEKETNAVKTLPPWGGEVRVSNSSACGTSAAPFTNLGTGYFEVTGTKCFNPALTAAAGVGPSPWSLTAQFAPYNIHVLDAPGGSTTQVTAHGVVVCQAAPCSLRLNVGETMVVTYTGAAPSVPFSKD